MFSAYIVYAAQTLARPSKRKHSHVKHDDFHFSSWAYAKAYPQNKVDFKLICKEEFKKIGGKAPRVCKNWI